MTGHVCRGSFRVVPLLCVLDLSPTGRSPFEVTQLRLLLSGCAPLYMIPIFIHTAPMVEYQPISAKDITRLHQFGPKVLPGIFIGYALHSGGIWKGDIMIAGGDNRIWADGRI